MEDPIPEINQLASYVLQNHEIHQLVMVLCEQILDQLAKAIIAIIIYFVNNEVATTGMHA